MGMPVVFDIVRFTLGFTGVAAWTFDLQPDVSAELAVTRYTDNVQLLPRMCSGRIIEGVRMKVKRDEKHIHTVFVSHKAL